MDDNKLNELFNKLFDGIGQSDNFGKDPVQAMKDKMSEKAKVAKEEFDTPLTSEDHIALATTHLFDSYHMSEVASKLSGRYDDAERNDVLKIADRRQALALTHAVMALVLK